MSKPFGENLGARFKSEDLLDKGVGQILGTAIQALFFEGKVSEMCEILVRARDGLYSPTDMYPKRGHLVAVMPNGHIWGRCECPPEYFIIKIPVLSETLAQEKNAPVVVGGQVIRRRRYRISETLMAEIEAAGGVLTVTAAKLNAAIIDSGTT